MHLPAVRGWPEFSDFLSSLQLLWDPADWSVSSPTPEWLFDIFCRMRGISKDERKNYYLTPNLTSTGTKTFVVNDREETMKLNLVATDIDVDSDNDNGLAMPDENSDEEDIENITDDPEKPGKLVEINDGDTDNDGVPDFADGMDRFEDHYEQDASAQFVPVIVKLSDNINPAQARIRITYSDSDPAELEEGQELTPDLPDDLDMESSYEYNLPDDGHLRLWTKDGDRKRKTAPFNAAPATGNFVPSGEYIVSNLPEHTRLGARKWRFFVEGVKASSSPADREIKIQVDPDGDGGPAEYMAPDTVRLTVYDISWVDEKPDYSLPARDADSDNFFLRRRVRAKKCDYKNLKLAYRILPFDLPVEDAADSVRISIYKENTRNRIQFNNGDFYLPGEMVGGEFATGYYQHIIWPDVRDDGEFRDLGFYRPQLEVDLKCLDDPIKTPIEDADTDMPGWQCPQKGLGIHDLVWKHRPEVYMGDGEVVAEDGPIYPFDDTIITRYRLRDDNGNPCWDEATEGEDYASYGGPPGGFPKPGPDFENFSYQYEVLVASENNAANTADHRIQMLGQGETLDGNDEPLHQNGDYSPYVCYYGIPPEMEDTDNSDNHVFVQFWHYETASFGPYGDDPDSGADHVGGFVHDGDWEMAQLCVQLRDTERITAKAGWLLPWGATASQHYYGQTLAWRHGTDGENSSREEQRRVIHADNNGYRFKIYIADNSHATNFRKGRVNTSTVPPPGPTTQVQYKNPAGSQDAATAPIGDSVAYNLLQIPPKNGAGVYDWTGRWGSYHSVAGHQPPPGPDSRHTDYGATIDLTDAPAAFYHACRKHVDSSGNFDADGQDDPLTTLLKSNGKPLFP